VQFVNVPEEGVPKAPPLVTSAPEDPTLIAKAVATFVPKPLTPVEIGSPVQLVNVPEDGVPSTGVTSVGDVANTKAPEPVSSVTADAKLADDGVPKKVATPAPKLVIPVPPFPAGSVPVTLVVKLTKVVDVEPVPPLAIANVPVIPVLSGKPVQLVNVPALGVPKLGVVNTGDVVSAILPDPETF
jgi:hypothetical protein